MDGHEKNINFLCFPELTTSFSRLIAPFCEQCDLCVAEAEPVEPFLLNYERAGVRGGAVEHGAALDAFARRWYSKDSGAL